MPKPILKLKKSPRTGIGPEKVNVTKTDLSKPKLKITTSPRKSKMQPSQTNISQVPRELFPGIFSNLKPQEILNLCQTNKIYKKLCDNDDLWRKLLQRDYPDAYLEYSANRSKSWFEIYKESYFLHKKAKIITILISESEIKIDRELKNLKRGDLVEFVSKSGEKTSVERTSIYDGEKLVANVDGMYLVFPEQFEVVTEFPPNYWGDYKTSQYKLLWFDANKFMDQLLKNSRFEVDTSEDKTYVRTNFVYNNIQYTIINTIIEIDEDDTDIAEYLDALRVYYASKLYVASGEDVYLSKNIKYPGNKTLFVTDSDKYEYDEYTEKFNAAAEKGDFVEYKRIADNINSYDVGSYLTELFENPTSEEEVEFWINYEHSPLDLGVILVLDEDHDEFFYKALAREDFMVIEDNVSQELELMLEIWERNDKAKYMAKRIKAVVTDPRFPKEDLEATIVLLKEYNFPIEEKKKKSIKKKKQSLKK